MQERDGAPGGLWVCGCQYSIEAPWFWVFFNEEYLRVLFCDLSNSKTVDYIELVLKFTAVLLLLVCQQLTLVGLL